MLSKKYTKLRFLGQGSFGKVFLLQQNQSSQLIVDKVIPLHEISPNQQEKVFKQVHILSKLSHQNIIKFRDCNIYNDELHIFMQYASKGDLSNIIEECKAKRKYIAQQMIIDWTIQLLEGIQYIHRHKVIHRDLKSQNIFIGENNRLKIGDFGVSTLLNSTNEKAKTLIGTIYSISPEVLNNQPYTQKADIWSLGTIIYELCTLKQPFEGQTLPSVVLKITCGQYQPITRNISRCLKQIIQLILQKDPNLRPSATDLLNHRQIAARKFQLQRYKLKQQQQRLQQLRTKMIQVKRIKEQKELQSQNSQMNEKQIQIQEQQQEEEARTFQNEYSKTSKNNSKLLLNKYNQYNEQNREILSKLNKSILINNLIIKDESTIRNSQINKSTNGCSQNKTVKSIVRVPVTTENGKYKKYEVPLHIDLQTIQFIEKQLLPITIDEKSINQSILQSYRIKLQNILGDERFLLFYKILTNKNTSNAFETIYSLGKEDRKLFNKYSEEIKQLIEFQKKFYNQ